jgi:serine protease DegQ
MMNARVALPIPTMTKEERVTVPLRTRREERKVLRMRCKAALILVAAVSALGACQTAGGGAAAPAPAVGSLPVSLAPMLADTMPAVVNVAVQGHIDAADIDDPDIRRYLEERPGRERRFRSVGSGVVVDAAGGYIVTNAHVVVGADAVTVTLGDRRDAEATVVGIDEDTDIAVLRIPAGGLTEIAFGDSRRLRIGDFVVAIGSPFGLGQTATLGIVSATGRSGLGIESYEDFIQTDAAINLGNSGGALVDVSGRLVGINTAILSPSGVSAGIGFAIPAHMVRSVVDQIVTYGQVTRGRLGVTIEDLTPARADDLGIAGTSGALITAVAPGTAAAQAGLRRGDIVIALDQQPIGGASALRNAVGLRRPDTAVTLTVRRGSETLSITTPLGAG